MFGGSVGLVLLYMSGKAYPNGTSGDPNWNTVFYVNLLAHMLTLGTGLYAAFGTMANPEIPTPEDFCDPTVEVCLDPVEISETSLNLL